MGNIQGKEGLRQSSPGDDYIPRCALEAVHLVSGRVNHIFPR